MTTQELYEIIQTQQKEIQRLKQDFKALKEWSDLNDYWLREMIDALTDSVDRNMDRIAENKHMIEKLKQKMGES